MKISNAKTEYSNYTRKITASVIIVLLTITLCPIGAYATPLNENNTNTNPAPDTDTPSNNTTLNENAEQKPWDENTNTNKTETSETEILNTITSQMVKNSGLSEAELATLTNEIKGRESELKQINLELGNLKDSLHTRQREVDSMNKLITTKEEELTILKNDITKLEAEIKSNKALLSYYFKEYYKFETNAVDEIGKILFSGKNITDVLNQIDFWNTLEKNQIEIIETLKKEETELNDKKAESSTTISILEQSKTDIISANESLDTATKNYNDKMSTIQTDIALLKGQEVLEQEGYLKQIYSSLLVTPNNMTETEAKLRAEIVKTALSTLGTIYVWGGESWDEGGFDCSGLCHYAYAQQGIILPRVACDQYTGTPKIALQDLRPGDMIYQGSTPSNIYHVMMYIGDGLTIEAPNFGEPVQIRQLAGRSGIYGYSSPLAAYKFE